MCKTCWQDNCPHTQTLYTECNTTPSKCIPCGNNQSSPCASASSCKPCGKECKYVVNIIDGKHINTEVYDNDCGKDVIVNAERPKFVSSDDTINIEQGNLVNGNFLIDSDWDTFDFTSKCCEDKLVATQIGDIPWYNKDKILTCDPTKLSINTIETSPWFYALQFCPHFTDTNDKVSVKAWCPADYLANIVTINDNEYMEWDSSSCNLQLVLKPKCLKHIDMVLQDTYTTIAYTDQDTQYDSLPVGLQIESPYNWPTCKGTTGNMVVTFEDQPDLSIQVKYFECDEDGRYNIAFGGQCEVGTGIASVRNFMCVTLPWGWFPRIVLETAFTWPNFRDLNSNNSVDANERHEYLSGIPSSVPVWYQVRGWLARTLNRIPMEWSRTVYLEAGSRIFFAYKVSTITGETITPNENCLRYYGSWPWGGLTATGGSGVYWSVNQQAIQRLTD